MRPRNLTLLVILGLGVHSLHGQEIFIVRRDIPENPSLVVVPISWAKDELEHADKIEELLISFGLKVVQRPSTKVITETKGAVATSGGETAGGVAGRTLKEEYIAYQETGAQYVLLTDDDSKRFKLVAIKSHEILATVKTGAWEPCAKAFQRDGEALGFTDVLDYCLYRTLERAGLPVKKRSTK